MHARASEATPLPISDEGSAPSVLSAQDIRDLAARIQQSVATVIDGKDEVIQLAVVVLLAGGHLLLEDVPGVGKTMLAKALARSIDAPMRRIQFTPDLLPSDITGINVFNQKSQEFEFRPGAVFAGVVVGDEINRASPKTQSALLEAMEEEQVTIDGLTYRLPRPFIVIATQNPIEMEGTYPLPEAQRDRFMARLSMGYPSKTAELAMLQQHQARSPLTDLTPVADAATVAAHIDAVSALFASPALCQYVVDLVAATRASSALRLGASPRATLGLLRAAKALAGINGRDHVLPEDVQELAPAVLAHRVLLGAERQHRQSAGEVIREIVRGVPVPARAS